MTSFPPCRRFACCAALMGVLLAANAAVEAARPEEAAAWRAPDDTQIVVKFRPSVEPRSILSAQLIAGATGRTSWRPTRLRPLFTTRAPRLRAAHGGAGLAGVYVSDLPPGMTVDEGIARLAKDPRVEYVQPDHARETHGTVDGPLYPPAGSWGQPYDDLWGRQKLNVADAWDLARGTGIVVAVVDSGVDSTHPDLQQRMWSNPEESGEGQDNGYPGDTGGWDFVADDNDPRDEFGHGTHIAGIIASPAVGVAPETRIMAVRAINGAGAGSSSTIAAGIVYAADNGANVITVSSGCVIRCPSDPVVESAVRHATALGAIVVVSAGNRGDNLAYYSPQNMVDPRPIVVAASTQLDQRASFGNYGELVDVVAPGGGHNVAPPAFEPVSNILSLASSICSPRVCDPRFLVGDRYLRRQGTSMAAAHVSGVIALLLEQDALLNPDTVRERLFGNVDDLGPKGHDAMFGWGRVTALNSVADIRRYVLARILSPSHGQVVSGVVRIVGAAAARTFSHYEVSVGPGASPVTWTTSGLLLVGRSTPQGDLADWNTSGLAAGPWTIRLVVQDTIGGRREYRRRVTLESAPPASPLFVSVTSEGRAVGSVHVDSDPTSCDAVPRSTQTCSYTHRPGTSVTLTAVAGSLSAFAGWSGDCAGTGPCTVEAGGVHGVRAMFRGPYKLLIRSFGGAVEVVTPADATCGESCYLYHTSHTPVTLLAYPGGPLITFGFRSEPCAGNYCELPMDRDRFVVAEASEADVYNPQWLAVSGSQRLPLGMPLTLQAFAIYQYHLQYPVFPVTFDWINARTSESLAHTDTVTVQLGLGLHDFLCYAFDSAPLESVHWTSASVRIIVHEP